MNNQYDIHKSHLFDVLETTNLNLGLSTEVILLNTVSIYSSLGEHCSASNYYSASIQIYTIMQWGLHAWNRGETVKSIVQWLYKDMHAYGSYSDILW